MKSKINTTAIEVPIKQGQRLSEVKEIYPLPSGAIIHKKLPGLGATYGEINAPRHSLIVLPNRPVIETKVAEHNKRVDATHKILGVHKGITDEKIIGYFNDERIVYKKVLTTPESYDLRLKKLLADQWHVIQQDYYLLIDECERSIQDKDFRTKISAPFDDFFDFRHQGLISATTLPFSDPKFEALVHYNVKPDFEYQQPLNLVCTNNIAAAFREYLQETRRERYFIFLNSIGATTALIDILKIRADSKIHCSEKSKTSLKFKGFNASSQFDKNELAAYNFFTSRYYSGMDIKLPYRAEVVMITEVVFAEHSILDPKTEVIQIVGRFRNEVQGITHISNFNSELECKDEGAARTYLSGQRDVFLQIMRVKAELQSEGAQGAINDILKNTQFTRYFKADGSYNFFMLDNYIQEQRVLGLYRSPNHLVAGYEEVSDHFKIKVVSKPYPLTDKDRLRRQSAESRLAEIKLVVEELKRLIPSMGDYTLGGEGLLNELTTEYPDVVKGFRALGEAGIQRCGYRESRIRQALDDFNDNAKFYKTEVLQAVHSKFRLTVKGQRPPTNAFIETTLQDIFDRNGIKHLAIPTDILRYFEGARTTTTISGTRYNAYRLNKVRIEVVLTTRTNQ